MHNAPIDALEPRRLLAATLTSARLDTAAGKVVLVGSANADIIQVARFGRGQAQVIDGGDVVLTFDITAAPKGVSFSGGDGADYLSMGRTPLRLYADGGDGADALSGSRGGLYANTMMGGSANDYLFGGTGPDTLDGGGGDDTLLGYDGNDVFRVLSDSSGDDTVLGGLGEKDAIDCVNYNRGIVLRIGDDSPGPLTVDDRVYGGIEIVVGTGFDDDISTVNGKNVAVYLGLGNDRYQGGRGNETVYGGRGNDTIATAGGDDVIYDYEGTNRLNGSGGNDTAYVLSADDDTQTTAVETVLTFDAAVSVLSSSTTRVFA